ncbi:DNA repair protein RecO [Pseudomarimonas arenosa]|uniref:DNA repair protein RecO n=1 Tax=Pseudomarimonas arenosa TaxID=2774145 RepID=A0AAW3ZHT6_9GAMM|nr:DNA repair protein RecO [Pseudomarimonas arenosa]MBD8524814.1 DNA repair protein RecO [Pseudomarimonas arenosa]
MEEEYPAYVLHARPYRETSLLIELLVLGLGRVGCVARGVRGARAAARRAVLQPLQPLQIRLTGRGELAQLQSAEAAGPAIRLNGDALLAAFYLNELFVRLLPRGESQDALFLCYARSLGELEQGLAIAPVIRAAEYALLSCGGSMPPVDVDVSNQPLHPEQCYMFDPERGAIPCETPGKGSLRGAALLALQSGAPLSVPDAQALRQLMRGLIEAQLGGRPLNSWGLLAGLKQHA